MKLTGTLIFVLVAWISFIIFATDLTMEVFTYNFLYMLGWTIIFFMPALPTLLVGHIGSSTKGDVEEWEIPLIAVEKAYLFDVYERVQHITEKYMKLRYNLENNCDPPLDLEKASIVKPDNVMMDNPHISLVLMENWILEMLRIMDALYKLNLDQEHQYFPEVAGIIINEIGPLYQMIETNGVWARNRK